MKKTILSLSVIAISLAFSNDINMGEKYKNWQHRFEVIKEDKITQINDMIIEQQLANKKMLIAEK